MIDMTLLVMLLVGGVAPQGMTLAYASYLPKFGTDAIRHCQNDSSHHEHFATIQHGGEDTCMTPWTTTCCQVQPAALPQQDGPDMHPAYSPDYTTKASLQDKIGDALIGEPDHCPLSINMMGLAGQPQTGPPPDTSCRGKKDCASWDRLRAPHRLGRPPAVPPPDRRVMYPECIPDYMIQGYDKKTDHGYNMIGGPNQVAHWGTGGCIPEATPQTQDGETEEISMVQTLPTNNAWYAFLKALRDKLEGMPCEEKIQASEADAIPMDQRPDHLPGD